MVELLIVTVIFVVLLAAGVPGFAEFVRNQRVKTASFDLFSTLIFARSEAITRNSSVTVAPVDGDWTKGWSVTEAGGTVLREEEALASLAVSGPASLVYRSSGRLSGAAFPAFELSSGGSGVVTRCIRVDLSGRPYTKAQAC